MGCYSLYSIFHLAVAPLLAIRSIIRSKRRDQIGHVWKRLLGGSKPPHRANWVVIFAGGIGERRVGFAVADVIRTHRDPQVAVFSGSIKSVNIRHDQVLSGHSPYNNPISALLFLLRWRPKCIIVVEFWDNHHLKAICGILGIKTVVVNVPISPIATRQVKPWNRWRYQFVGAYCVQGKEHRLRLEKLGIAPKSIVQTGVVGFRIDPLAQSSKTAEEVRQEAISLYGLKSHHFPIVIAGSTYPPDEGPILTAYVELRKDFPNAVLFLVPRNPKRRIGPESTVKERGLGFTLRTDETGEIPESGIVVVNTYGELKYLYSVGQMAHVGGTMAPNSTGHTPVEALAWYLPITIGPHFSQQKVIVKMLEENGLATVIRTEDELAETWRSMAKNPPDATAYHALVDELLNRQDDMILRIYDKLCL